MIPAAYLLVVLIWSTTPITVAWSGESVDPVAAAGIRMAIAAVVGMLILAVRRIKLRLDSLAIKSYVAATLGTFGAMCCVYLSARYIPSGLISVLFGLAPMLSALFSRFVFDGEAFPPHRWFSCLIALLGLAIVFMDDVALGPESWTGIGLLLMGVSFFSLSGVMVKQQAAGLDPLVQTLGSLILSLPCYTLTWYLLDGSWQPLDPATRSFWSIVYLALVGSLLGFASYYFVLKHLSASTVALVTLITPIFALLLGHLFNDEPLSERLYIGSVVILGGLASFFFGGSLFSPRKVRIQG
ncbi:Permease of the drug/metabolite transporter (DMT) superfamily [Marinobacterium lacunae]|uniref:Permease of the drug/metabolite transporter (DMT) superfamily n=1 Tax=Marinobacterium lacunae TaxID=1232683 RepID=A0A081G1G6_9GAMM|nr:DMT family transporter [Marinobacterium lacunae]KEA64621.1 Permease of the drug/metabolite transporter (DMT) superfamily [Marinobacterium lacunae]